MSYKNERLCLLCEHFSMDFGSQGYSDYTPGGPGRIECYKKVWKRDATDLSEDSYRELLLVAEHCQHFKHYKG